MARDPRKIAAAAIGVVRYLEAEKAGSDEDRRRSSPAAGAAAPQGASSLWPMSGSLFSMQTANLMRYRMFRGP